MSGTKPGSTVCKASAPVSVPPMFLQVVSTVCVAHYALAPVAAPVRWAALSEVCRCSCWARWGLGSSVLSVGDRGRCPAASHGAAQE